jgi:hypothetical protein
MAKFKTLAAALAVIPMTASAGAQIETVGAPTFLCLTKASAEKFAVAVRAGETGAIERLAFSGQCTVPDPGWRGEVVDLSFTGMSEFLINVPGAGMTRLFGPMEAVRNR